MIHIVVGMEVNMVRGTHFTVVMDTKATQAVAQRSIRIGLTDIKFLQIKPTHKYWTFVESMKLIWKKKHGKPLPFPFRKLEFFI